MFDATQQVQVTIDNSAAPVFELAVQATDGDRLEFDRSDPFTDAVADEAYDLALAGGPVRLPEGAIRVLVLEDEFGRKPPSSDVAQLVARRLAA